MPVCNRVGGGHQFGSSSCERCAMRLSPIQERVLQTLWKRGGHGTSKQIAEFSGFPTLNARQVATTLCWLRGAGLVNNDYGRSKMWKLIK